MESGKDTALDAVFELSGKEYTVAAGQTIRASLQALDLNPELYLCVLCGELVTDDRIVEAGDSYRLVAVVSGGDN
ncbi:MAG: MoaD/ThiS family protein [Anaerolineales bacterium]|jgi:sulfur carrier protein ThiS|nr:MoaD/ThiS family protein [Anaerolineales bacterium]|tara:strand:+ start:583 stop:807 length:225 start_codon:yes stop_codon:yes gene_type:complete